MREGRGRLLLQRDKLNLEKISIPLSCFLTVTSPPRSPLLAHSSSTLLIFFSHFPHKDALPVLGGE